MRALNYLNLKLEDRVQERTEQLLSVALNDTESLLHNMNQAVFIVSCEVSGDNEKMDFIVEDKVVSDYSKEIFKRDIKGQSVYDVLFKDIDFSSEEGVQIKTAFECSYGLSDLQWDESIDYLPKRIEIFNNPENVKNSEKEEESPDNEENNRALLRVSYKPLWDKEENLEK